MTRTRYGLSPWQDRVPKASRPAHPRFRGDIEAPVVIVGGGLTGTATAYVFAAAGIGAVLLEAETLGLAGTARSAGLILADPAGEFLAQEAALGRRAARALWQATRRGALDMAAAIRRLNFRCGLEPADSVLYVRHGDEVRKLQREAQARRDAGLDASWLSARALTALRVEGAAGIRTRGHARVDPYRACLGFARAAAARGAVIFERSAVRRVVPRSKHVEVMTADGTVRCGTVVLATAEPPARFAALRRHFVSGETYMVLTPALGAAVRKAAPATSAIVRDRHEPPHYLTWTGDDRMLWGGADGPPTPARGRDRVLVQRGGQLMYELSVVVPAISGVQPEYVWEAPSTRTHDGLPFIGPHRNYPRHLFALGLGASLTGAFLAARVLLRHYEGRPDKEDEHFGFSRFAR
jgi:glycine/D-amino acid oxidase-like deaminating enzyme